MMGDDMRGNDIGNRKHKFESNGYSPSASYKYSPNGNFQQNAQQQPRRRNDRYKRTSSDLNERIVKQNDQIIKLLKEIRDRLGSSNSGGGAYRYGSSKRRGHGDRAKNSFSSDDSNDIIENIDDEITLSEPASELDIDDLS